jgi:hypothetical protein
VRLTEAGERYYQDVREALSALDPAAEQVSGTGTDPQGLLRINAPVAFGRRHIAPLLSRYQARHRGIEVELTLTDAYISPDLPGKPTALLQGSLVPEIPFGAGRQPALLGPLTARSPPKVHGGEHAVAHRVFAPMRLIGKPDSIA